MTACCGVLCWHGSMVLVLFRVRVWSPIGRITATERGVFWGWCHIWWGDEAVAFFSALFC